MWPEGVVAEGCVAGVGRGWYVIGNAAGRCRMGCRWCRLITDVAGGVLLGVSLRVSLRVLAEVWPGGGFDRGCRWKVSQEVSLSVSLMLFDLKEHIKSTSRHAFMLFGVYAGIIF